MPLEKTGRNYKQAIILTVPRQMSTFTSSTVCTHNNPTGKKRLSQAASEIAYRLSIAGFAESALGSRGKKTYQTCLNVNVTKNRDKDIIINNKWSFNSTYNI